MDSRTILGRAYALFRDSFASLFVLFSCGALPIAILEAIVSSSRRRSVTPSGTQLNDVPPVLVFFWLPVAIIALVMVAAAIRFVTARIDGREISLAAAVRTPPRVFGQVVVLIAMAAVLNVMSALILIGFLVLAHAVSPGPAAQAIVAVAVVAFVAFSVLVAIATQLAFVDSVEERCGGMMALGDAFGLLFDTRRWRSTVSLCGVVIALDGLQVVVGAAIIAAFRLAGLEPVGDIVQLPFTVAVNGAGACVVVAWVRAARAVS